MTLNSTGGLAESEQAGVIGTYEFLSEGLDGRLNYLQQEGDSLKFLYYYSEFGYSDLPVRNMTTVAGRSKSWQITTILRGAHSKQALAQTVSNHETPVILLILMQGIEPKMF